MSLSLKEKASANETVEGLFIPWLLTALFVKSSSLAHAQLEIVDNTKPIGIIEETVKEK